MLDPRRHLPRPADDRPSPLSPDLREAAHILFPEATAVEPIGETTRLARVEDASGIWCVRRWRPGTLSARPVYVQTVLAAAAARGFDRVPTVPSPPTAVGGAPAAIMVENSHFDAQSWMPGRPLGRTREHAPDGTPVDLAGEVSLALFIDLIETVARFHLATAPVAPRVEAPRAPLAAVSEAVRRHRGWQFERLRPWAPRNPAIQSWIRHGERAVEAATAAIAAVPDIWQDLSVVGHHDLWPAHVLVGDGVESDQVLGLVDLEDLAVGSPLLDLAQIVNRFGGWSADAAETALGAYAGIRPLSPAERRLFPAVATLDAVIESGRLLIAAHRSRARDEEPATAPLRIGAAAMVRSLEALTPLVLQGETPPSRARQWIHRPRPGAPNAGHRLPVRGAGRTRRDTPPRRAPRPDGPGRE